MYAFKALIFTFELPRSKKRLIFITGIIINSFLSWEFGVLFTLHSLAYDFHDSSHSFSSSKRGIRSTLGKESDRNSEVRIVTHDSKFFVVSS